MKNAMIVRRRSRAARALRPALLVMLLIDAVLATEAAAPAAQAAHWPPRTRLLDAPPPASGTAVTTTSCTGASAGLAPDQCAAWGQFWDGAGGPNWVRAGQGCTKIDPCGCSNSITSGVRCSGSSITSR
jgi:hypothetical protein